MRGKLVYVCAFPILLYSGMLITGDDADFEVRQPAEEVHLPEEVHLVNVYEGFDTTGRRPHGPRGIVHVDRPGKRVTLVLGSYSGATWQVTASDGTEIGRVILGGYEPQAVEGVPATTEVTRAYKGELDPPLFSTHRPQGQAFRQLIDRLYSLTKTDVASFHGVYEAPRTRIVIDEIDDDPTLSIDFPQLTPASELPDDLLELKFFAHHYVGDSAAIGEFTVRGPNARSLRPLPRGIRRVTFDPDGKKYYGIAGHDVVELNLETGEYTFLDLGLDVPQLSSPCDLTYDTERKRVTLGSSGGGGFLYAFSPQQQRWSAISERPGSFGAFAYSPHDDLLYGVFSDYSEAGTVASLGTVNPYGAVIGRIPLGPLLEPGSLSDGTTQVATAGKYVVILTTRRAYGSYNTTSTAFIYVVDPATKQVWLTSKEPVGERGVPLAEGE